MNVPMSEINYIIPQPNRSKKMTLAETIPLLKQGKAVRRAEWATDYGVMMINQDFGWPWLVRIYRLDEVGIGEIFFQQVFTNAEIGDTFQVVEMTEEEWIEAERLGEEMS